MPVKNPSACWGPLKVRVGRPGRLFYSLFPGAVFLVALPLIGIGIFSLWGGLRFTIYAVPVAAISAIYLVYIASGWIRGKTMRYAAIALMTIMDPEIWTV
jgi:hypothetical protein